DGLFSLIQKQKDGEHEHRAPGNGGGVPANLAGLRARQQQVADPHQARYQANAAVDRITTEQAAEQQIGLDEQLVVEPVEAPGSEPPGRQQATRRAGGHAADETALAEEQQGGEQDTGHGDGTRGDFQADPAFAPGMADALRQHGGQWRGDQRADKGRQYDQRGQWQVVGNAVTGVGLGLLLAVEGDEDQAE